jgi:hypothetical protein
MVQIYYWEHHQSEERPLEEFFRGESNSLIQWQPPHMAGMPVSGMQMQGMPMQGMPMQGMPMQGMSMQGIQLQGTIFAGMQMQGIPMQGAGMDSSSNVFATVEHGGQMDLPQQPASKLNGVRCSAAANHVCVSWPP